MARLLLRNGTVFDGLGTPGRTADVLVDDGVVTAVGEELTATDARVIDCAGRYVTPGFVDLHSHSDLVPLAPEPQPFKLYQGVTTEVTGNCGITFAPTDAVSASVLTDLYAELGPVEVGPVTFGELLDRLDRAGPTNNIVPLVGHSALRVTANGTEPRLRAGAAERMRELAAEAFAAGAFGLSTGLIYSPGCFADTEEIVGLARVAAAHGGLYATHMRDEGPGLEDALDEAVRVAREAGCRLQVSHCKASGRSSHGRSRVLLDRLEQARLSGVDVYGDQYPYLAGSTVLVAMLPTGATVGGRAALVDRLSSPDVRRELREQAERGRPGDGLWAQTTPEDTLLIGHANPGAAGRTLADLAGEEDPFEVLCRLVVADSTATVVLTLMDEADVRTIMRSPLIGVGSDNLWPAGLSHPRTWGCFPVLLGRYVRDLGVLSWPEAIRKATSLAARQFGLTGRGALVPGYVADLVAFDPETIGHTGTYLQPDLPVTGMATVVLGGEVVVDDGQFTGVRAGRVLRRRI